MQLMVTKGSKLKVGFVLFVFSMAATAALQCQDLRLMDPTSSAPNLSPSPLEKLPLEPAQQAAVRHAVKVRDYPRAEAILVEEINKNPKAPSCSRISAACSSWMASI
jgi:hypothetical protein